MLREGLHTVPAPRDNSVWDEVRLRLTDYALQRRGRDENLCYRAAAGNGTLYETLTHDGD
jgi:hypothetical protein